MVGCIVQSVIVVAKLFYLALLRAESQGGTHPDYEIVMFYKEEKQA